MRRPDVDRQHFNGKGAPKVAHATLESAHAHAAEIRARRDRPCAPYVCGTCGLYHVGTWRPRGVCRPSKLDMVELGDRVAWNLFWENARGAGYALRSIEGRCRRAAPPLTVGAA